MAHTQPAHARDAFPKASLDRIAKAIADAEAATYAEIRVSIHDQRETDHSGKSIAEVAKAEFAKLGMHKTSRRVGLLLLVLYSERKFYILADHGLHHKVKPETWTDVAHVLGSHFKEGHFEAGIIDALLRITEHLRGVLPKPETATNELANDVAIS